MKYIGKFAVLIKRLAIFFGSILAVFIIYTELLPDVWRRTNFLFALILLWAITAYFVLPRVHRFLSRFYVPDNFVGRSRTADGILNDPVNMGINGSRKDLIKAMESAGWVVADDLTLKTTWKMAKAVVLKQSYPTAPMSNAFLFGKQQGLAFEIQIGGNPRVRHHVRFWRTPRRWHLPGGRQADWLGAATHDEKVGLSLFTMQFTHAIHANADKERDFLIKTLEDAKRLKKVEKIEHFFSPYSARNGFGHEYVTDGSMVIADLRSVK